MKFRRINLSKKKMKEISGRVVAAGDSQRIIKNKNKKKTCWLCRVQWELESEKITFY